MHPPATPRDEGVEVGQRRHPRTDEMLVSLREEKVATWFDLGLFLDRLREDRPGPGCRALADLPAFERDIAVGVGFLTFDFGIVGVSM